LSVFESLLSGLPDAERKRTARLIGGEVQADHDAAIKGERTKRKVDRGCLTRRGGVRRHSQPAGSQA
jgi:hypothetical protein